MAVTPGRRLIVNADDVGQTRGINAGVRTAYEDGIVTSGSLMVRFDAAAEAAAWARDVGFDLGLHVDLGEWSYVDEEWVPLYEVLEDATDPDAVEAEVQRQLDRFRTLMGRDPSHLDSHQHRHNEEPLRTILDRVGAEIGAPVRGRSEIRYEGSFYGQDGRGRPYPQAITPGALIELISSVPTGTTELGCHPGVPEGMDSMYASERAVELATLTEQGVRETPEREGVTLLSFAAAAR